MDSTCSTQEIFGHLSAKHSSVKRIWKANITIISQKLTVKAQDFRVIAMTFGSHDREFL